MEDQNNTGLPWYMQYNNANPPLSAAANSSIAEYYGYGSENSSSGSGRSSNEKVGLASSIFTGLGNLLQGGASLTQAITGNYPDTYYVQGYNDSNSRTSRILIIGGVLLAVVVLAIIMLKK